VRFIHKHKEHITALTSDGEYGRGRCWKL